MNWKWIGIAIVVIIALSVFRSRMAPEWLSKGSFEESPTAQLIGAAGIGDTAAVRDLIEKGIDINAKNEVFGHTALIVAARQGYADVVQVLIEKGADVNAEDRYGSTALQWAQKNGHTKIVDLLKEAGAREKPAPTTHALQGA
jgi:ankyrin repeat protein